MKTSGIKIPTVPKGAKITIILEDLEFGFENWELAKITEQWEQGDEIDLIAKRLMREIDEVFLALFHQARLGRITRPFAWRKS